MPELYLLIMVKFASQNKITVVYDLCVGSSV